jgi:CRP-like cAMP-binding protein|tara:strand:- start:45 stop:2012 length:1968 start_codon:yes stop_codon:yes gene_type:complete
MGGAHGSTAKEAKEAESMIETLEMTPLLKDIEPDAALKVICPLFVRMKIKEEESIYGPKSMQPDDMCVVESGALRLLTKHGIPGQEGGTELHRYGAGDVLGATQMAQGIESVTAAKQKGGKNAAKNVHDNSPTDVLACSGHDVVLLVFSLEVYEKYILDGQEPAHEKFRENIATLTHDNCSKWLRRFNFFDSLDQQQLTLLAQIGTFLSLGPEVEILKQGTVASAFYILLHGTLQVSLSDDKTEKKDLGTLQSGALFGESALLGDLGASGRRGLKVSASVFTQTQCLVLKFNGVDFKQFLKMHPHCQTGIEQVMKLRDMGRLQALQLPIFEGLSQSRLAVVLQNMETITFGSNDYIFSCGDKGDFFYVLLQGVITITDDDDQVLAKITRQGEYFGEMALVSEAPRNASAIATESSTCARLSAAQFRSAFMYSPVASAEFELKAMREKSSCNAVLSHPFTSAAFKAFLETEHAEENYLFWDAVRRYRTEALELVAKAKKTADAIKESPEDAQEVLNQAALNLGFLAGNINDLYVDTSSKHQVNLPNKMVKAIAKKIESAKETDDLETTNVTPYMFDDAQNEIVKMLEQDNLKRFAQTQQFESVLDDLGSYIMAKEEHNLNLEAMRMPSTQEIDKKRSIYHTEATKFRKEFQGSMLG